jgi:gliding motility-associated-like protein
MYHYLQSSPRLENLAPGTYSVFVRDKNTGCISNARNVLIKALDCTNEIFIPNVFSPNGNSKNERFKVYGNRIVKIDMKIYNQWGQQVAVVTDRKIGWDGTHKGKPQPAGVYIYVLDAAMEDGSLIKRKGSITLIR